jgi:molybdopterin synthase catalytic subunit/molybdopterin synthase sulfur carrier subunit
VTIRLLLFASSREAAGRASDTFDAPEGSTLRDLLTAAEMRYGNEFVAVLATARVWVNGDEPASGSDTVLGPDDEVAVLPPVSGGSH